MLCLKCGKENGDDAKFCRECGQKLSGVIQPTVDKVQKPNLVVPIFVLITLLVFALIVNFKENIQASGPLIQNPESSESSVAKRNVPPWPQKEILPESIGAFVIRGKEIFQLFEYQHVIFIGNERFSGTIQVRNFLPSNETMKIVAYCPTEGTDYKLLFTGQNLHTSPFYSKSGREIKTDIFPLEKQGMYEIRPRETLPQGNYILIRVKSSGLGGQITFWPFTLK